MWIFTVLPEMVIYIMLFGGIIGLAVAFSLGSLPFLRTYTLAIQIFSVISLAFGLFLLGGLEDTKIWKQKVLELEVKLKDAELKSAEVNTVIQEKVVTKTKVVKEKADEIIKYIDRDVVKKEEVIKYVERCSLPQDIVDAHNKAIDELNAAGKKK